MALTKVTSGIRTLATNEVVSATITDSNVTTAKIADNAVTLAKMAGLADGKIIVGDANGDPSALAAGNAASSDTSTNFYNGEFLETAGSAAVPAWVAPLFTKYYTSGEVAVEAATDDLQTFAHGLGEFPKIVQITLKCKDAGGDAGFADNEELALNLSVLTATSDSGFSLSYDGTSIYLAHGLAMVVMGKSTFNGATLTLSKWNFIVKAWA
jgi:hypothetical protein